MLSRILEPEVMDTADEAETYDAMDHGEVNAVFVADLIAEIQVTGTVLDLGTGTALIPIELCQRLADIHVVAVDLAESMLKRARERVEAERLIDRIRLERQDAKSLPYPTGEFAAVISNSIIHHVAEPGLALAEAVRVTRDRGWLFFRDLVRPESESHLRQLADQYTGSEPPLARTLFANSLRAALTVAEMQALIADLGFPVESVRQTSDRHWTWSGRRTTLQ